MLRALRTTGPAPGHERVLYPGLSEAYVRRCWSGGPTAWWWIPFHREVVDWFDATTDELSVPRLRRT